MEVVPPGRRKRGRPKQRWMDCVNRDMRAIGTTSDKVHDRTGWRRIVSAAATPQPSGSGYEKEKTVSGPFFPAVPGFHVPPDSIFPPELRSSSRALSLHLHFDNCPDVFSLISSSDEPEPFQPFPSHDHRYRFHPCLLQALLIFPVF